MQLRLLILILFFSFHALAQEATTDYTEEVDAALKEDSTLPTEPVAKENKIDVGNLTPSKINNLGDLIPFKDVAVIQKRFLPKTGRFEFTPGLGYVINDAFFNSFQYSARAGYYFTEQIGIEALYLGLSTTEGKATKDLREKPPQQGQVGILTTSLVTPKSYYGGALKWSPIYGKFSKLDKTIIPFDMYFVLGYGLTQTNQNTTPGTFHFGTGQNFAITKSMAFRWDLSWFIYSSTTTVTNDPGGSYTNMHLTLGMSFFFPEAKYR